MNDFFNWLVTSSSDPQKVSLTVRGALLAVAPVVIYFFGLTEADFSTFVNAAVDLLTIALSAVAAIQVIFGIFRKINFGRWSAAE